jgi:hypothetical protein
MLSVIEDVRSEGEVLREETEIKYSSFVDETKVKIEFGSRINISRI